jgi:hypothetical protein
MFFALSSSVVEACIKAGLGGGEGFAVDASLIAADANKCRSTPGNEGPVRVRWRLYST